LIFDWIVIQRAACGRFPLFFFLFFFDFCGLVWDWPTEKSCALLRPFFAFGFFISSSCLFRENGCITPAESRERAHRSTTTTTKGLRAAAY
jgi:hypothetical protein